MQETGLQHKVNRKTVGVGCLVEEPSKVGLHKSQSCDSEFLHHPRTDHLNKNLHWVAKYITQLNSKIKLQIQLVCCWLHNDGKNSSSSTGIMIIKCSHQLSY